MSTLYKVTLSNEDKELAKQIKRDILTFEQINKIQDFKTSSSNMKDKIIRLIDNKVK